MPSIIFKTNRNNLDIVAQGRYLPTVKELFSIGITFILTVFAWIVFRAENLNQAIQYISGIFNKTLFQIPPKFGLYIPTLVFIFLLLFFEWVGRERQFAIQTLGFKWGRWGRWAFYCSLIVVVFYYSSSGSVQQFIYFQF